MNIFVMNTAFELFFFFVIIFRVHIVQRVLSYKVLYLKELY